MTSVDSSTFPFFLTHELLFAVVKDVDDWLGLSASRAPMVDIVNDWKARVEMAEYGPPCASFSAYHTGFDSVMLLLWT